MTWRRMRMLETGFNRELEAHEAPLPEPSGSQVLVEVEACGVCYRDTIDRSGRFAFIQLPVTPGHEAVGRVVAVGSGVSAWKAGDRVASMHRDSCGACPSCQAGDTSLCPFAASVLGLLVDGGYSSHILAPERCFYPMPNQIPAAMAAILHCTYGTAYRGLVRWGQLKSGQRALITGANGGVGAAAIQIAKRLGAGVVAVVRSEEHAAYCKELGADEVLVNSAGDFHRQLGQRVEVALDCVGEPTFNAALRSLSVGGRIVSIGNVVGKRAELNLGYIITTGLSIHGSSGATPEDMRALLELHARDPLTAVIHEERPLAEADAAQRRLLEGNLHGRIVLRP
ncbi:MAG: alcohol dehydrogenase catalytic domain-containing protein [Polyangiaceae bacterium]